MHKISLNTFYEPKRFTFVLTYFNSGLKEKRDRGNKYSSLWMGGGWQKVFKEIIKSLIPTWRWHLKPFCWNLYGDCIQLHGHAYEWIFLSLSHVWDPRYRRNYYYSLSAYCYFLLLYELCLLVPRVDHDYADLYQWHVFHLYAFEIHRECRRRHHNVDHLLTHPRCNSSPCLVHHHVWHECALSHAPIDLICLFRDRDQDIWLNVYCYFDDKMMILQWERRQKLLWILVKKRRKIFFVVISCSNQTQKNEIQTN